MNKKRIKKLAILMSLIVGATIAFFVAVKPFNETKPKEVKASSVVTTGDFRLTAKNRWSNKDKRNYPELTWDKVPNLVENGGYSMEQFEDSTGWEKRSTKYGKTLKVLNVYPDIAASNTLKGWMDSLGFTDEDGNHMIDVTPVPVASYNANPNSYLKDSSGEYQYDVLMFGSWDFSTAPDLNQTSYEATLDYINLGYGVLFAHDTLLYHKQYFRKFNTMVGLDNNNYGGAEWTFSSSIYTKVMLDGYLMKYPFEMKNGQTLTVPISHNIHLSDTTVGTTWLEFTAPFSSYWARPPVISGNYRGAWYLKTNENTGMIQVGHNLNQTNQTEKEIIADALYGLALTTREEHAYDYLVKDDVAPEVEDALIRCGSADKINVRVDGKDHGKDYQWRITANTTTGDKVSDTVKEEIKSNIGGYFYEVSNSATSNLKTTVEGYKDGKGHITQAVYQDANKNGVSVDPDTDALEYETSGSFTIDEKPTSEKYVHIVAVDRASNVSVVKSYKISDLAQPVDFEVERTADEAKLVELALDSSISTNMKSIEIQIPKNTEIKDFASLTLPTSWYSFENSETADYYSFTFAMETNNSIATIQPFLEDLRFTIKSPVNDSGSIKVIFHKEIYTYWIAPDGKRHYYAFIPEVETWMEAYNRAKTMSYRGLTGYLATLTSEEEHDFVYDNIGRTFGWLGGTRLRVTTPAGGRINDESHISPDIAQYTHAVGTASDWYWANGPEAGTVFFDKPTFAEGGKSPAGVYNGFNNVDNNSGSARSEPNNGGIGEFVLQFAQANETKYWNDIPYNGTANVAGFYIEFSEYGGQTEGDEVTDLCWSAAVPQKLSLKAYDETGNAVTHGDLLYDQELRIGKAITVKPKDLDYYLFLEARELDDTVVNDLDYTISNTYQQGKLIYALRRANLHVRQVIRDSSNELVVPTKGYITIRNQLNNAGSPAIDPNYQGNLSVSSGKEADNPGFTDFGISVKHLSSTLDQVRLSVIVPEFYQYEGYYLTDEQSDPSGATHASNTSATAGEVALNRARIEDKEEFWITVYLKPTKDDKGKAKIPQPYSWDYKKNDFGKIKTK